MLRDAATGLFVTLVHLRRGSVRVVGGDRLRLGESIGACGDSGSSTQPHVHLQVTDTADMTTTRGLPVLHLDYQEWPSGGGDSVDVTTGVPAERPVVGGAPPRPPLPGA
ncbi:hypothetical protein GCM10027060_10120 [Nesterenkonia halophila]